MDSLCPKCNGKLQDGVATAYGLVGIAGFPKDKARLIFTLPGTRTSFNPVTAFKQGLSGEPDYETFWIKGQRCSECGFLELFAKDPAGV